MNQLERNNRILVIDDNPAIHADMGKILCPAIAARRPELDELEAALLGGDTKPARRKQAHSFEVSYASQGQEGLAQLQQSIRDGRPYAMAFVDMRMPPGWDGLETTLELWNASPELQVVICTAYSDYSWDEFFDRIGYTDRLVILKKPFESVEVLQLAHALTTKWSVELEARTHAAELEERVRLRTAELESSNTALMSEIERRQLVEESLVIARDAAEAAARAKSTFLANMSHEVRTPMNGVIGMANLLMNTGLDEEQQDIVRMLTQSGESLLAIINDILDFSKVEAGKIALESIEFDLVDELALAIDLNSEGAAKKGVELILDIAPDLPRTVKGDPVRLRQVLINLVSNAIKFTEHGEVVVRLAGATAHDSRCSLRVEVTDTGIGIAPDSLATLFQPFMQGDASMTRRFGGTGLGLAISRRLVEIMGGRIGADSEAGRGSTFWFEVGLEVPTHGTASTPGSDAAGEIAGRRILVVDASATFRTVVTRQLEAWGVPHGVAESPEKARLEVTRAANAREAYHVVLIDQSLLDAYAAAPGANDAAAGNHSQPVVAVLTRGRVGAETRGKLFPGVGLCETKPLTPGKLRSLLAKAAVALPLGAGAQLNGKVRGHGDTARQSSASRKARILVADDNEVNQKVAVFHLRRLGHEADVAANGREALAALAEGSYDLVFMDAHMPELDGLEATRIIRRAQSAGDSTYTAHLRIIAMTAHVLTGAREECLAAGMDDFLPKPITVERLSELLENHLPEGHAAHTAQNA